MTGRHAGLTAFCLLLLVASAGAQTLTGIRKEFAAVGERVIPATVIVRAMEVKQKGITGSTGVVVHPDGYVLSDADATITHMTPGKDGGPAEKHHGVDAIVRLPAPDHRSFRASVVLRDPESDTTLLKIVEPPKELPWVPIGSSDALSVGSFNVIVGNSFGSGMEGEPALSMGVVSALVTRDALGGGKYSLIYTSAAVNPGMNGGPCVDAEGRLVGVISSWDADPKSPFRTLGMVTPVDRIRARYSGVDRFEEIFPDPRMMRPRSDEAAVLEEAFSIVARHAYPSLVSIEVDRGDAKDYFEVPNPMRARNPKAPPTIQIPLYPGPYSGVVIREDGHLLTCLANLWSYPKIKSFTVHLPDGRSLPAEVVARDGYRQVALLKVEATGLTPLPLADPDDLEVGQFALAVANPFGKDRQEAPLFTFGVISGLHRLSRDMDAVQTDAGMTDGMVGGAVVNLQAELVGLCLLYQPDRFGRNSGIGFAIPMSALEESLPDLLRGKDVEPGKMGIAMPVLNADGEIVFRLVAPGGPAGKAGLKPGDVLLEVDGESAARQFGTVQEFIDYVRTKAPGRILKLRVLRGRSTVEIEVTLGPSLER
jgi:S1-C subfamily serine protease